MRIAVFSLVAALALAACAKQPDQISAVDIGEGAYANYSCRDLATERLNIEQDLANLSAKQKSAASGDAWGVFLLGLPLSSMSGGDQEALISVAKGKIQVIDRMQAAKRCN